MSDDSLPPDSEKTTDPLDPAARRGTPCNRLYLMKDDGGNVIYVESQELRSRASSYFSKKPRRQSHCDWIVFIRDVDFIETADSIAAMFGSPDDQDIGRSSTRT